jgi:uncharacterized protein YjbI with pentapeptide repeats
MDWRSVLFGWPARVKPEAQDKAGAEAPAAEISVSAGNGGEPAADHVPVAELRSSQQHQWLFDDGVLRWNRHRHDKEFKPNFAGVNFLKETAKTRLWGRPADLVGDERAVLTGIDLSYADLQGCTLTRADLRHARLIGADLRKANLSGALLNNADLSGCDLRGANLDGAQFARANLVHANLSGASLKNVNFAWADLSHAIVGARNLQDANVFGCRRDTIRLDVHHPRPA